MINGIIMGMGFGLGLLILGAILANIGTIAMVIGALAIIGAIASYGGETAFLVAVIGLAVVCAAGEPLKRFAERPPSAERMKAAEAARRAAWDAARKAAKLRAERSERRAAWVEAMLRRYWPVTAQRR